MGQAGAVSNQTANKLHTGSHKEAQAHCLAHHPGAIFPIMGVFNSVLSKTAVSQLSIIGAISFCLFFPRTAPPTAPAEDVLSL